MALEKMDQQQENNEMWSIEKFYDGPNQYCPYITVGPAQIRFTQGYDLETDPQRKADAEAVALRIAQSVFACRAIDDGLLSRIVRDGFRGINPRPQTRILDLEEQRDKLLEALRECVKHMAAGPEGSPASARRSSYNKARALITEIEN